MKKYLLIAALCLALTGCVVPVGDAALDLPGRDGGLGRVSPEQLAGWLEGGG